MKELFISPSGVNLMDESPCLFWLATHKLVSLPRGIFSGLPGAIDKILKDHYDKHRVEGMPPEVVGQLYGRLWQDQDTLKKLRFWNGPQKFSVDYPHLDIKLTVRGAVDDVFQELDGTLSPLDYKTAGKEVDEEYGKRYYQNQLDFYALLLEKTGRKVSGKGYLVYYYCSPSPESKPGALPFCFRVKVLNITALPGRASLLLDRAATLLSGPVPSTDDHELITFGKQFTEFVVNKTASDLARENVQAVPEGAGD
jgi:hypothetical protein